MLQPPPPVAKKPSLKERQMRHSQSGAIDAKADAMAPPVGYTDAERPLDEAATRGERGADASNMAGHHREPQRLRSSRLADGRGSPWLDQQLQQRQLQDEIDDLKVENKVKSRELEANKWIENEMNRKLRTADDAYMLRHLLKDKERHIANQEKIIADLTEDNSRLAEDVADKERSVFQLQSEVDNLDRVILAKNALREAERLEAVSEELDAAKDALASSDLEIQEAKVEMKNLSNLLSRKERELRSKSEQLENLNKELRDAKGETARVENEKSVAENHFRASDRENKLLQEQNEKLLDFRERCQNLEEENAYLAEANRALEANILHLEALRRDKEALEDLVHDLKAALKDKNEILKERRHLQEETRQLKDALREKSADEAALQKEFSKIKELSGELERENDFYRELETDFHKIKHKYEEMEREKFRSELAVAKLRPRLERQQKRCKEKDDLIRRLANELRGGGERLPRELLQEADRNQRKALDDYVDPVDYVRAEDQLAEAPLSKSRGQPQLSPPAAYEPSWPSPRADPRQQQQHTVSHQPKRDADFRQQQQQQQQQQAPIARGQQQQQPESRTAASDPQGQQQRQQQQPSSSRFDSHPERPFAMDAQQQQQQQQQPTAREYEPATPAAKQQPPLEPPTDFRISRELGDGSLLLEWRAPQLDSLDRNNGIVVAGYQIFVNGIEEQRVGSSRLNKSLISRSSVGYVDTIGIQTFGYDGEVSERVDIPVQQQQQQQQQSHSPLSIEVPNQHAAAAGGQQKPNPSDVSLRRAVRDYEPSQHSPSAFPSFELQLRAGDRVRTFGPVRPDGMYNAEVGDRRGLVPARHLDPQ